MIIAEVYPEHRLGSNTQRGATSSEKQSEVLTSPMKEYKGYNEHQNRLIRSSQCTSKLNVRLPSASIVGKSLQGGVID